MLAYGKGRLGLFRLMKRQLALAQPFVQFMPAGLWVIEAQSKVDVIHSRFIEALTEKAGRTISHRKGQKWLAKEMIVCSRCNSVIYNTLNYLEMS